MNSRVDECVEAICQKGCQATRNDLTRMENGEIIMEISHLSKKEQTEVQREIAAIMAVYGDACPVD
ncbi:MAG: hypothetical protein DSZ32_01390 [Gammaproteobacteria bacterium]|nr:MAG: hypothetical protein DSZ33_06485 [Gammaproteobacteria bacterium]RTZ61686.1 MAG: hypothetical protein DSZ32_01390 [Gammaproteobacteria bacterium]